MGVPDGKKYRYQKTLSLGEILDMSKGLRRLGIRDGEKQIQVYQRWEEIVGREVARNTLPLKFTHSILTVAVSTPLWLQEMTMMKGIILANVAACFGTGYVQDIRFRVADFDLSRTVR